MRCMLKNKYDLIAVKIKKHRDKKGGHPHIILEDIEENHVSVGLSTHPTKGKGSKNYHMEKNPFGYNCVSYMRRQGTVAPIEEYGIIARKGSITPKDYERAKLYGERAKKKYTEKKDNKKR